MPDASDGKNAQFGANPAAERTLQATHLLQQALALLGTESMLSAAGVSHRSDRLVRMPEVQRLTGLRRSAIYEQMQRGTFPRSVKVGPRAVTWSETDIQGWIAERLGDGAHG
jgi:prophage regulatory protein